MAEKDKARYDRVSVQVCILSCESIPVSCATYQSTISWIYSSLYDFVYVIIIAVVHSYFNLPEVLNDKLVKFMMYGIL